MLLFYAFGMFDADAICTKVQCTARWADLTTLRRLLYATVQHTAAVRNLSEALMVLTGFMAQHQVHRSSTAQSSSTSSSNPSPSPTNAAEELLNANVLPHLMSPEAKLEYRTYLIGVLLNHLFLPSARRSQLFDSRDSAKRWIVFFCILYFFEKNKYIVGR